eukprot:TRINITY_DN1585_c0_g1_i1.p1 TRINITY_DN1585_c0_g1~~TRINITY_DN1585_c0_g1_i1.p1  ORF type:complete len:142 (-),score=44.30 TRINITY_DN1585_c0_g1_i1:116-541(-)
MNFLTLTRGLHLQTVKPTTSFFKQQPNTLSTQNVSVFVPQRPQTNGQPSGGPRKKNMNQRTVKMYKSREAGKKKLEQAKVAKQMKKEEFGTSDKLVLQAYKEIQRDQDRREGKSFGDNDWRNQRMDLGVKNKSDNWRPNRT